MGLFERNQVSPEMQKVMDDIAQVEGNIQQKLFQLGQMYYEKYKNNPDTDPELYVLVDLIAKLDVNRKGFYENKLRLEGKMMCANCGEVIPYGSVYCSSCGKRADIREEKDGAGMPAMQPAGKICKKCGTNLEEDAKFCAKCGTAAD